MTTRIIFDQDLKKYGNVKQGWVKEIKPESIFKSLSINGCVVWKNNKMCEH